MVILFLIILSSMFFVFINLRISKNDYLNPAVIFSLIFLMSSVMCLFALTYLKLEFHAELLVILNVSYLVFTLFSIFNQGKSKGHIDKEKSALQLQSIHLPFIINLGIICCAILLIWVEYRYLGQLAQAAGRGGASLSERIALYDNLLKFYPKQLENLRVGKPSYYQGLSILTLSLGYINAYLIAHNLVAVRKTSFLEIINFILFILFMYFGGSRSTIVRLLTFVIIVYYILFIRSTKDKRKVRKVIRKFYYFAIITVVIFLASLSLYGRTNVYSPFHYLFVYTGAPLYNLDVFIQNSDFPVSQELFGQQTFFRFYDFWIRRLRLETYELALPFVRYSADYGLGNVYTTFYQFLYDFGYSGIVPLISLIAYFYTNNYNKLLVNNKLGGKVEFRLFVYAYLFNDLLMLFFSNRFYETGLGVSTLRIFVFTYFFVSIVFEKGIVFGNYKLVLRK